jgi:hypothetical protein
MGFIDWSGNKEDRYDEVVAMAKYSELADIEDAEEQRRKEKDANSFGVPELIKLEGDDILKLIVKEKKGMDMLYSSLTDNHPMSGSHCDTMYHHMWLYTIGSMIGQSYICSTKKNEILTKFLSEAFGMNVEFDYFILINDNRAFRTYMNKGFKLCFSETGAFWDWIRYLSSGVGKLQQANQFIELYQRVFWYLAYYLNQTMPGNGFAEAYRDNKKKIKTYLQNKLKQRVSEEIIFADISELLSLFVEACDEEESKTIVEKLEIPESIDCEEVRIPATASYEAGTITREEVVERVKPVYSRYLRMILVNESISRSSEESMLEIAQIYHQIKENTLTNDRIISVLPEGVPSIIKADNLPEIAADEVHYHVKENESIHYLEHGVLYERDKKNQELHKAVKGTLYFTNMRVRFETGNQIKEYQYGDLGQILLHDGNPDILEFISKDENTFVRLPDTQLAYQILRKILIHVEAEDEDTEGVRLEDIALEFFEREDLDTYIFCMQSFCEGDMPREMKVSLKEVIKRLNSLNETIRKYPNQLGSINRFITYYIPEVLRLVYNYQEYYRVGIDKQELDIVYGRVMTLMEKLHLASAQRVTEIYKTNTMNTVVDADSLHTIMNQDGYVDIENKIEDLIDKKRESRIGTT